MKNNYLILFLASASINAVTAMDHRQPMDNEMARARALSLQLAQQKEEEAFDQALALSLQGVVDSDDKGMEEGGIDPYEQQLREILESSRREQEEARVREVMEHSRREQERQPRSISLAQIERAQDIIRKRRLNIIVDQSDALQEVAAGTFNAVKQNTLLSAVAAHILEEEILPRENDIYMKIEQDDKTFRESIDTMGLRSVAEFDAAFAAHCETRAAKRLSLLAGYPEDEACSTMVSLILADEAEDANLLRESLQPEIDRIRAFEDQCEAAARAEAEREAAARAEAEARQAAAEAARVAEAERNAQVADEAQLREQMRQARLRQFAGNAAQPASQPDGKKK